MKNSALQLVIAVCLVVLAGDRIYERFFNRIPQMVYVRGGDMSVSVSGGDLDSVGTIETVETVDTVDRLDPMGLSVLDVNVKGGKLDYPTDFQGNLRVSNTP
ncbi:hypothetical protein LXM94_23810 [Rhizobium sp. TRM95111]|uniref:hypothetical protein n=1 Tax=Rhizobium alarense TaxID=2846851 RepID=UPI001F2DDF25|nr:hypothetical protein [Rhizobium alarense]MCF3642993.1 hypothetical protein [Rhizobium alarense]